MRRRTVGSAAPARLRALSGHAWPAGGRGFDHRLNEMHTRALVLGRDSLLRMTTDRVVFRPFDVDNAYQSLQDNFSIGAPGGLYES